MINFYEKISQLYLAQLPLRCLLPQLRIRQILWLWVMAWGVCGMSTVVHAAPLGTGASIDPPVLIPLEATTVQLLTHTADFTLRVDKPTTSNGSSMSGITLSDITLAVDATYRLENDSDSPVPLIVKIAETTGTQAENQSTSPLLNNIVLSMGNLPLELYQTEGVGYTAQLRINPNTRTTVYLQYQLSLAEQPLPLLAYQATELAAWPGSPSLRMSIVMPDEITPESWLHIAPAGWHYATTADANSLGIQWLYDGHIPQPPFLFEFIHPEQWTQIQQLTEQGAGSAAAALQLGNRYRTLLEATPLTADYQTVRDRFYAQALAAYSNGLDLLPENERNADTLGDLYAALAELYRLQLAQPDGVVDAAYTTAMIDAAQRALASLPTNTLNPAVANQRRELSQWVADGLQVALVNAQQQENWSAALDAIEQLSALPPELVNADMLEQTKRTVTVRQALQLLEEENRDGALALAGEALLNSALLPPADQIPLFRRWEISATVSPATIEVIAVPFEREARSAAALDALNDLVITLQAAAEESVDVQWQPAQNQGARGRLIISAPTESSFASLTTAIPLTPNWTLLYTLLRQLQPTIDPPAALVGRNVQLRLPMDLRTAGALWQEVASDLLETASALEREAAAQNSGEASEAEQALQLRIQAGNYRITAQEWQAIGRSSWVALHLVVPSGLQEAAQTSLLTVASPSVTLTVQGASSYLTSFMSVLVLTIGGLLFLSGLLWWLL